MEVSGQLHIPSALPPGKELLILIEYETKWVPQPVWTLYIRENIVPYRKSNPVRPARNLVIALTEVPYW
jgi:hypothetical protein